MAGKATKTLELFVTTKNEIGAFAKLTLPLKQNNINIDCYCAYEDAEIASFHLMTNDNQKSKELLTAAGYKISEKPVILWTTDNTPGEVNKATQMLAESGINIIYSYSTSVPDGKTQGAVFSTSDNEKTYSILNTL